MQGPPQEHELRGRRAKAPLPGPPLDWKHTAKAQGRRTGVGSVDRSVGSVMKCSAAAAAAATGTGTIDATAMRALVVWGRSLGLGYVTRRRRALGERHVAHQSPRADGP